MYKFYSMPSEESFGSYCMKQSLNRHECLKSRQGIDMLFTEGSKLFEYPLLMRWKNAPLTTRKPLQFLVSVSKKRFRGAAKRIRIKRLIREAFRKNKPDLCSMLRENDQQMMVGFVYVGKEMPSYKEVEEKTIILLQRLSRDYERHQKRDR